MVFDESFYAATKGNVTVLFFDVCMKRTGYENLLDSPYRQTHTHTQHTPQLFDGDFITSMQYCNAVHTKVFTKVKKILARGKSAV